MSLIARFIKLFTKASAPASVPVHGIEHHSGDRERSEPATMNICRHFIDDEGNISHIRVRRSTE